MAVEDKSFTWREFLKLLLNGLTPAGAAAAPEVAAALKLLEGDGSASKDPWADVKKALKQVKGYYLEGIGKLRGAVKDTTGLDDDLSQQKPETRLFFLIEYRPGDPIMEAGTYSDYVALYKQGGVHLVLDALAGSKREKSCWDALTVPRTWLGKVVHRLFSRSRRGNLLSTAPVEPTAAASPVRNKVEGTRQDVPTDLPGRLLGFTSVFWKQPRAATLLAVDDENHNPCQMVLVKRILLRDCLLFADEGQKEFTQLYKTKVVDFFKRGLPQLLARNRLFRPLFYVEEVQDWAKLLQAFAPGNKSVPPAQRRVRDQLPRKVRDWLGSLLATPSETAVPGPAPALSEPDQYRAVSALNDLLNRPDLYDSAAWALDTLPEEERDLLGKEATGRTVVETYRLNRLLIEAAYPGVFRSIRPFKPRTIPEFEEAVEKIRAHSSAVPLPLRPREGETIFEAGAPADGLYLILEGRVRLSLGAGANRIASNHLWEEGFIGESCIAEEDNPRHLYAVEALTNCNLLKIERRAILELAKDSPDLKNKLLWEKERMRRRAEEVRLGHRLPPANLTPETAAKLMRATNLLVIDMDRCTRCDQCVRGCTESHQGQPRFHRANPQFRVGTLEVAGACVHCADSPCLEVCPSGAITLLANRSVQVLRARCISCRQCEAACPFGVIEYFPPVDADDGASAKKADPVVSNKCDLCLTPRRDPPCVVACPYGAAQRGAPSEFFPGLKSMARFTEPE